MIWLAPFSYGGMLEIRSMQQLNKKFQKNFFFTKCFPMLHQQMEHAWQPVRSGVNYIYVTYTYMDTHPQTYVRTCLQTLINSLRSRDHPFND